MNFTLPLMETPNCCLTRSERIFKQRCWSKVDALPMTKRSVVEVQMKKWLSGDRKHIYGLGPDITLEWQALIAFRFGCKFGKTKCFFSRESA